MEPIKCPKCGAIVKVTAIRFPDIEWKCLMCGESGSIKQGATSVYIQKVDEPDLGIGVTTTNAEGITTIDPKSTACDIPAPKWIQQGWECPKCGAILAPNQRYCPFCSKKESNWTTTVGTGTQPFYSERTQKDNLTPQTGQYTNPNTNNNNNNNTAPSAIPDYRPFCSPSEYGRTNWLGTNTPTSGQYTNSNTSTTISKVTQ